MSKPLADHAVLVALNIRQWTARKYDRSVSKEVDRNHGAKDGGRYNKLLISKAALEAIEKVAGAARAHHYDKTLAWSDNGDRLLPSALFMDYTQEMQTFRIEFENRVRTLIQEYPQLKVAARAQLGSMYDPDDYPADIADRFQFSTSFSPVPDANDFRVNLSTESIDFIKRDLTDRIMDRQKEAVKEVFNRARAIVGKIHEQTSNTDRRIYDSAIENARSFVDILPALNLTNDPVLASIEDDIRTLLIPPDRLRADKTLRANTARAADSILARLPWA